MSLHDPRLDAAVRRALVQNLKPPPKLDLVQWADEHRYLSPEASSEPGKWQTARVEVARGMMLAITEPGVREVTVMACTQLAKTELLNNIIGYFVHQDPAPILVLQPTVKMAEAYSKDRIDPMFRDTPVIRGKLGDRKSKDGGNTILHKQFAGGHLTLVGANAPADLAMRPVRVVLCDEVDKYPHDAGGEGDPIKLASERAATFWNSLVVKACSPTVDGRSRISFEYERSDKRVYEPRCPHCEEFAELKWPNVRWPEGKPQDAAYYCGECGCRWTEPDRLRAIAAGRWRATAPFNGHAGFKVNKLCSPWEPVSRLAEKWVAAQGSNELLKTFVNTQLAETWKEVGEAPEWQRLVDRREPYRIGTVPRDVGFLTAGVDVQKDRLEVEVVGWCRGRRSYSVDYRVLLGDTADRRVWDELAKMVSEQWEHESGATMGLRFMAVDSGYRTTEVYAFCRRFGLHQVAPVKGMESQNLVISPPRAVDKTKGPGLKLFTVGTSVIKTEFYGFLRLSRLEDGIYPDGYAHFPEYEPRHFRELTSEQVQVRLVRGFAREIWVRDPAVRNEPLDCRVYARAAAAIVGIDRMRDADWAELARQLGAQMPSPGKSTQQQQSTRKRRSSYWD